MVLDKIASETSLGEALSELQSRRSKLTTKISNLTTEVTKVDQAIEVIQGLVAGSYTAHDSPPHDRDRHEEVRIPFVPAETAGLSVHTIAQTKTPMEWKRILNGLTNRNRLVRIAELNGGVIKVSDARDIFAVAGLSKGKTDNLYGRIYRMLGESSTIFQKKESGYYELISAGEAAEVPEENNKYSSAAMDS